jgi:outer membrane protein assembly factor BamD
MVDHRSSARGFFGKTGFVLFLLAFLLVGAISGCSTTSIDENDPAALIKDAQEDIQSDHYQLAIDKLRSIKNKFPYSKYAIDAQLLIADVYFMQDSFADAAASYESFRDLHPRHEKASYALFRVGKSYFKDSPSTIARDLTSAKKALDAYNDFLRFYPTSEEVAEAKTDIATLRQMLAEKELYIGDFYFKRDFFESAKPRYKKVIELFPETEAARTAEAKLKRIESLAKSE